MSTSTTSKLPPARRNALRRAGLLDLAPDEGFDRLTRLAMRLTGAAGAAVVLFDGDGHIIRSAQGLAARWGSRAAGASVEHALRRLGDLRCVVGIGGKDRAEIPPRDFDVLGSIGGRAFASVPLGIAADEVVGCFCVVDGTSRDWSEDDVLALQELAAAARTEIELRIENADRRRAETALREVALGTAGALSTEEFFSALTRHLTSALDVRWAFAGRVDESERGMMRTLAYWVDGVPADPVDYALAGTPCERIMAEGPGCFPQDVQQLFPEDQYLVHLGVESYIGAPIRMADGRTLGIVAALHDDVIDDADGACTVLTIFAARAAAELQRLEADALALRTATAAISASEARHRLLFDRNPIPMWLYDVETLGILAVNEAAVEAYGYAREEFLAMTVRELVPPEDADSILATRAAPGSGRKRRGPHHHRRKDGTLLTAEVISDDAVVNGRRARLMLARDITEREALEAQLRQSQKMEAVGQLAGGVAHDFNNLLTVIRLHTELLADALAESDPRREDVAEIARAADRAAALTRQLLAFSRRQVLQPRVLVLDDVVRNARQLLHRVIGADIRVETRGATTGRVRADPGQIEQVLVNLAVNARDAMPDGGRLVIETADVELDEKFGARHGASIASGPYVMLAVTDTGIGMDHATQARIFEPFFTTKDVGKGTGLGLSTVYGIVKQSGGSIWVESEPGAGSTFRIYLPRVDADVAEREQTPEAPSRSDDVTRGSETILLVEDEDAVRTLASRMLRRRGYRVLDARHGNEALDIVGAYLGRIDLVVTDIVMPDMGGTELARRIRELRPSMPLLFMSGYSHNEMERRGTLEHAEAFLQKPFTADDLARRVRETLDAGARSAA